MRTDDPMESFPYLLVNLWSVSVLVPCWPRSCSTGGLLPSLGDRRGMYMQFCSSSAPH